MGYSKKFLELIEKYGEDKILAGSWYSSSIGLKGWEKRRKYIAKAISRVGTILYIGCANGFLLRCLQEWSPYNLIPYGIDTEERLIKWASELFPRQENHFAVADVRDVPQLYKFGFLSAYDFIYWAVWDKRS